MIFLELFLAFLKIGAFTFGGGYAMVPLIQAEVERMGWLTSEELIDFIAVSESTPGPLAVNMATFVGVRTAGVPGALCATLGVCLPSFVIILLVAKFFQKFKESLAVKGAMSGLKPAVIGLIAAAFVSVSKTVFFSGEISVSVFTGIDFWIALCIFILTAVLSFKKKIHPIVLIVLAAALGIIAGFAKELPV